MAFKPMLADDVDLRRLVYPVVASPKLDGVRTTFQNGGLVTRSLKKLPNQHINARFKSDFPLDGELIVGDPTDKAALRNTMKVVTNHTAPIDEVTLYVFDLVDEVEGFASRIETAANIVGEMTHIKLVPHVLIHDENELLYQEEQVLDEGFEGLMLRDPKGKYKFGRSTVREGGLLKMKRKITAEARVIGFEEQMHNANEAKTNELGHSERSSHQENMIPMGILGALVAKDLKTGVEFKIGTGLTMAERDEIWRGREMFLNKIVTYEYVPYGVKDKPRHSVFVNWRMEGDL
jgi:DNA ligase-1